VAEVVERDGIYAVRTGVFSNSENGVIGAGDVAVSVPVARELISWFRDRQLPAAWLCAECEGRSANAAVLEAIGCKPERSAWEMRAGLAKLHLKSTPVPADTRVERARSEYELDAWLDVAGACGWFETEHERRAWKGLYGGLGFADSASLCLYVAFRGERAVGMASAFYTEELVLLNAAAVLNDSQRQGIGRSLVLSRLREARKRGCRLAVLAPSPDGAKLYNALGFETHRQPADRSFYLPPTTMRS
jgi:GNAT superfamily N-acetyltransferase